MEGKRDGGGRREGGKDEKNEGGKEGGKEVGKEGGREGGRESGREGWRERIDWREGVWVGGAGKIYIKCCVTEYVVATL